MPRSAPFVIAFAVASVAFAAWTSGVIPLANGLDRAAATTELAADHLRQGSMTASSTPLPATATRTAQPSPVTTPSPVATLSPATPAPPSTTTTVSPVPDRAPVERLDTFSWESSTAISAAGESLLTVRTEGVFSRGNYRCTVTTDLGASTIETSALVGMDGTVLTADDAGRLVRVETGPELEATLALCPGSEQFWTTLIGGAAIPSGGEPEERNGMPARRLDLTHVAPRTDRVGLPAQPGVEIEQVTVWVADQGRFITSAMLTGTLDAEALSAVTGGAWMIEGELDIAVDVDDPDDPLLALALP